MLFNETINNALLMDLKAIAWLIVIFHIICGLICNVCFMHIEDKTNKNNEKYRSNQKIKRK